MLAKGTTSRTSPWSPCWMSTARCFPPISAPPSASLSSIPRSPAAQAARKTGRSDPANPPSGTSSAANPAA
jgi:hypothetical protein